MKTLSLWQPHAAAIALSLKPFETRGWYTSYRGPLAIHAAKKLFKRSDYPQDYWEESCAQLSKAGCPYWELDYGKILCVVDVVDCVPTGALRGRIGGAEFWGDFRDVGDDGKKRYALKLACVRLIDAYKRPVVTGRQGFFNVPDNILQFK
jgi:hypothetical protein